MLFFTVTTVLVLLFPSAASIKCFTGFKRWGDTIEGDLSVKLEECKQDEGCCHRVDSLPGTTFKCAVNCPESGNYPQCDMKIDSGWCFCKDSEDENCAPFETNELIRAARDDAEANSLIDDAVESENQSDNLPDIQEVQCYVGFESSGSMLIDNETITEITVETCSKEHTCCHSVHSLPGSTYACSSDCPKDWSKSCGPQREENIMDVGWCYCKDYKDEKCTPSQFKSGGNLPAEEKDDNVDKVGLVMGAVDEALRASDV